MGRWDDAESLIEKLWGKEEVPVAMEELRAANSSQGEDEDITWSELVQAPYFKGGTLVFYEELFCFHFYANASLLPLPRFADLVMLCF